MADVNIDGVVTWLKNWFYDKTEIGTLLNAKANLNQNQANYNVVTDASGNITVEAKPTIDSAMSSASENAVQNKVVYTALSGKADSSHNQASTTITESSALSNIGTSANATQHTINDAINTKIGELVNIDFVTVVSTLPTASASTMGKIYLVAITGSGDNNYAEYITVRSGTSPNYTYAWEKFGEISGSGLSVDWSDITSKPSTYPPSSHTHSTGDVSDATAHSNIGSSANDTQSTINTNIDTALGNKGAKTDDVDWTYSSNGFTNGVKLVDKSTNANGRITLHLKS